MAESRSSSYGLVVYLLLLSTYLTVTQLQSVSDLDAHLRRTFTFLTEIALRRTRGKAYLAL